MKACVTVIAIAQLSTRSASEHFEGTPAIKEGKGRAHGVDISWDTRKDQAALSLRSALQLIACSAWQCPNASSRDVTLL